MLMHKKSRIEKWLDCFVEFCDNRVIDKLAPKRSAAEDAKFQKMFNDDIKITAINREL